MKWVYIALIACLIIGPFDALYLYIRAEKRKDARRRQMQQKRDTPDKQGVTEAGNDGYGK